MSQNTRRRVTFIPEVTFNTTPASPVGQIVDFTEFNMQPAIAMLADNTIRSDQQVVAPRDGNRSLTGTFATSFCPDNQDTLIEAVLGGTWAANVLNNGTTLRTFTFEESNLDTAIHRVYRGVAVNTWSLSASVGDSTVLTTSFGLIGASFTPGAGTALMAAPTAVVDKGRFIHSSGVIQEGGSTVGFITDISFEANNGITATNVLGATTARSMSAARFQVAGSLTAIFENFALYNKFVNSTQSSISVQFTEGAESLTILIPAVRFTTPTFNYGDTGPITLTLPFVAFRDTVTGVTMRVTRV